MAAKEDGRLGSNNHFNDTPIPPNSTKRVTIAPRREDWGGGKMVVMIQNFETE